MESIDKYLKVLEIKDECVRLNEGELDKAISKLTPESKTKSMVKKVSSSVNKRTPLESLKKISSILSFLPRISVASIDRFMSSRVSEYKSLKRTADVVLKNSISGISNDVNNYASTLIATLSFVAKKNEKVNPKDNLKKILKEVVTKSRKFMEEHEDVETKKPGFKKEDLPDLAVAWVIVVMSASTAGAVLAGGYAILAAIASALPGLLLVAVIFLGIAGLIYTTLKMKG